MKDVEPRLARTRNAERSVEAVMARLREIDGAQDLLDCYYIDTSSSNPAVPLSRNFVM